jgi:hypothetical protein
LSVSQITPADRRAGYLLLRSCAIVLQAKMVAQGVVDESIAHVRGRPRLGDVHQ